MCCRDRLDNTMPSMPSTRRSDNTRDYTPQVPRLAIFDLQGYIFMVGRSNVKTEEKGRREGQSMRDGSSAIFVDMVCLEKYVWCTLKPEVHANLHRCHHLASP